MDFSKPDKKWREAELEFLKRNHRRLSAKRISERIGRTEKSVRNRLYRLNLSFGGPKKALFEWTTEEVGILKNNRTAKLPSLMRLIPRHSRQSIKSKKHKCGYTEKPKYLADGYKVRYENRNGKKICIREHREIVERRIKRKLSISEQVHHIDLDKKNNESANLFLCRDRKHHRELHNSIEPVFATLFKKGIVRFNYRNGGYEICRQSGK